MNAEMILNDVEEMQEVKFGERTFTIEAMNDILMGQGWVAEA